MRTVLIELALSDAAADRWESLPAEERNYFATAAADALSAAIEGAEEADAETVAALQRAVGEMRAGDVVSLEEAQAGMEVLFAARLREPANRKDAARGG